MKKLVLGAACALAAATPAAVAVAAKDKGGDRGGSRPDVLALPTGWQPEGIAAKGDRLYVGSIPTGAVVQLDRKGRTAPKVLVTPRDGRNAVGLKQHDGKLFVAGGASGGLYVYDARTGADVAAHDVDGGFVNDVVVSQGKAYFTDSQKRQLYVLDTDGGQPATLPITGDFDLSQGFNANGIVAQGRYLVVVKTATGELFRIDRRTGASRKVDLGGATLPNGDGLLLHGKKLYVVQNQLNQVGVVRLSKRLTRGKVSARPLKDSDLQVPTTIARAGGDLYLPNAKFGIDAPGTQPYEVVRLSKRR